MPRNRNPSSSLASPDWVWSNNSTAHAATDRVWFSEYTPFPTVASTMGGHEVQVLGVGTVNLSVKRDPDSKRSGSNAHAVIVLRDVLHIPNMVCNIIGGPVLRDYYIETHGHRGYIMDHQERIVAHFDPNHRFFAVKPSGPPRGPAVGQSGFSKDSLYFIRVMWDLSERQRYEKHRAGGGQENAQGGAGASAHHDDCNVPYNTEEKAWLKEHYGNEFKFLQALGLSIYKDEDREEGRATLRALLQVQECEDEEEECEDDEEESEDDEEESENDEEDFTAHAVDYNFTDEELDFIEKHWKNAMNFMYSYRLRFYNKEDCEEAKVLVRTLMSADR